MSGYARKFYDPDDANNFVLVTWEGAYRNVRAYHNNEVIAETDGVANLRRSVSFDVGSLGVLTLGLTTEKPIVLTVYVNNERFYAAREQTEEQQILRTMSLAFWILFGLGVFGFMISLNLVIDYLLFPGVLPALVIDGLIVLTYGVSAFLCRKGIRAGYFIGTSLFTLITIYTLLGGGVLSYNGFAFFIALLIRGGILFFLYSQFGKISNMKSRKKKSHSQDLLDD